MAHEIRELLEFTKPSKVETLENGTVVLRRVKYLGARSSNVNADGTQNVYPLAMRKASEKLYEGAKLFADHPDRAKPHAERKLAEQIGRLRGPFEHLEEGSYADAYLNPKHPLAESIAFSAQHSPDDLGLSHNAQGRGKVQGKDCVIEAATRVRSVDFVCAAATTRGLFESHQEEPMSTKAKLVALIESSEEKKLLEMVDEEALLAILADDAAAPEEKVMKALALLAGGKGDDEDGEGDDEEPMAESRRDSGDSDLRALVEAQRKELDDMKASQALRERRDRREKILAESRLPKEAKTQVFVESVHGAETDEQARALIEDRQRLAWNQQPTSGGRTPAPETQIKTADDLFARL